MVVLSCLTLLLLLKISDATVNIPAKAYLINTSLPANEYLAQMCAEQKEYAMIAFETLIKKIPPELQPIYEDVAMSYWYKYVTEPYKSEIEYFSECIGNLSIKDIITVNLIYDLTAFCTSIVAVNDNGTIYHGRNFDFPKKLRNDTVTLIFVNGTTNETLYKMTTFAGYVGAPSGFKPNGFSISMDTHKKVEDPFENIHALELGYMADGWLIRESLIYDNTFDEAVNRLCVTNISAPIYYIVAGTDTSMNGAIITRNQTHVNGPRDIKNGTEYDKPLYLKDSPHGWYLVETNYDYWRMTPPDDKRREAAIQMMDVIGQKNITIDSLFGLLSTPPVLQHDTVFTTLFLPSHVNYYNATVRYDTNH
eukprot:552061_1